MRIEIVIFDGFDEIDALGPFEMLGHAGNLFDVALVGAHGAATIRGGFGARVVVDAGLGQPDGVIVPGGGWLNRSAQGSRAEADRGVLPRRLAEVATTAQWMASVCTGAMLLAEAGLLDGRNATTNRAARAELSGRGVKVHDHRVVDDGDIITAAGLTCGLDLALHLIERQAGRDVAEQVAAGTEYEARWDVWAGHTAR